MRWGRTYNSRHKEERVERGQSFFGWKKLNFRSKRIRKKEKCIYAWGGGGGKTNQCQEGTVLSKKKPRIGRKGAGGVRLESQKKERHNFRGIKGKDIRSLRMEGFQGEGSEGWE